MTFSYLQSSVMLNGSIEEQLLLCCARTHVDEAITQQIRLLIQQKIDWDKLIEIAIHQQVIPLLYRNLQQIGGELIPDSIFLQLREINYTNIVISMSLSSKLLEILAWFTTENIQVIPYKGAVLASAVYGDICLRQFQDLDLLIDPQDVTKSEKLLMSKGYQLYDQYEWEQTFIHPDQGVNIDLHIGVAQSYYPFRLDFKGYIQRYQSVALLDGTVQSFSMEDLLLVLSIQIVKDSYAKKCILAKVSDIAELVSHYSAPQWETVIDRAATSGCQRLLLIALLITHNLLGTSLPTSMWQLIKNDWVVQQYGKLLSSNFFQPVTTGLSFFLFKVLILIEYPLSAPSNTHLLKVCLGNRAKQIKSLLLPSP